MGFTTDMMVVKVLYSMGSALTVTKRLWEIIKMMLLMLIIISWTGVVIETLTVAQPIKKFPTFMEPENSLSFCVHKRLPLDPSLDQMNPVHTFTFHLLKINLNVIVASMPSSLKRSLPFRCSDQNYVCIFHILHAFYFCKYLWSINGKYSSSESSYVHTVQLMI